MTAVYDWANRRGWYNLYTVPSVARYPQSNPFFSASCAIARSDSNNDFFV